MQAFIPLITIFALLSLSTLAATQAKKSGRELYEANCQACHVTGAANAPKVGDFAAWKPRIAEGLKELTGDVIRGKGAMPPRAGNPKLTRAEIASAIVYMANQSGANWKEP